MDFFLFLSGFVFGVFLFFQLVVSHFWEAEVAPVFWDVVIATEGSSLDRGEETTSGSKRQLQCTGDLSVAVVHIIPLLSLSTNCWSVCASCVLSCALKSLVSSILVYCAQGILGSSGVEGLSRMEL